jgi:iduronate 2-sulfatase
MISRFTRHIALTTALCALATICAGAEPRLNVLFIVSDDLNTSLGCYGDPTVKTPSLDRLSRQGMRFDAAYCQAPLCNPSRVSFLSGRTPDHSQVYILATPTRTHLQDAIMLPECFRRNGYYTVQNGKIFHTGEKFEDPQSWDVANLEFGKVPAPEDVIESGSPPGPAGNTISWASLKNPDEDTPDGIVARKAVDYMQAAQAEQKPFFLGVGFRRPHAPYAAPKKYFDLYPPGTTPLPRSAPPEYVNTILPAALNHAWGPRPLTEQEQREVRSAYFACVSFIDAQVGVLLDAMDQHDLWKNTIVVFFGDHGYHLGEHGGLWHKKSLFEESCRVPLIVYAPKMQGAGKSCARIVELVDLYPTLTELCGLQHPVNLDGRSFATLLDDPESPGKDAAYSLIARGQDSTENITEVAYLGRSVRTPRWRYTEWEDGKRGVELYDHQADPQEFQNLAEDPNYTATVAELHRKLEGQAVTNDVPSSNEKK